MEDSDGIALSARKVDYLKDIYEHGGTTRTGDLAARFSVDPSTISKTIRELARDGFLSCAPYERIRLSASGTERAEFFIKRHRILSLALVRFGLTTDQACREASRFESLVSKDAIDTMCRSMGHPRQGVCGEITHDSGCLEEYVRG
jgi:Mn-dependent DtxR family transcriptional regulator